jgi:XTP/dITP diphosphohydrolase
MHALLLGSRNPGKVKEITNILEDSGWLLCLLSAFDDVVSPEENGETYADNAILKARAYAVATGLFALADDSGLEVAALAGVPGVF